MTMAPPMCSCDSPTNIHDDCEVHGKRSTRDALKRARDSAASWRVRAEAAEEELTRLRAANWSRHDELTIARWDASNAIAERDEHVASVTMDLRRELEAAEGRAATLAEAAEILERNGLFAHLLGEAEFTGRMTEVNPALRTLRIAARAALDSTTQKETDGR